MCIIISNFEGEDGSQRKHKGIHILGSGKPGTNSSASYSVFKCFLDTTEVIV